MEDSIISDQTPQIIPYYTEPAVSENSSTGLGWVTLAVSAVIAIATWVIDWINKANAPDTWSSWDDPTKEAFVTDALNAAFYQNDIPPRDWFWRAVSDAGYTRSDYSTFMAKNEWIAARVDGMKKSSGLSWEEINPAKSPVENLFDKLFNGGKNKTASIFSTKNIFIAVITAGVAIGLLAAIRRKKSVLQ